MTLENPEQNSTSSSLALNILLLLIYSSFLWSLLSSFFSLRYMTTISSHRFPLFLPSSLSFTSYFVPRTALSGARHNASLSSSVTRCGVQRPERHDSKDWMKALNSLPRSMILKRVAPRLVPNVVCCTFVTLIYQILPASDFQFSPLPHTFLATLMSLTLVFRRCVQPSSLFTFLILTCVCALFISAMPPIISTTKAGAYGENLSISLER